MKRPLVSKAYVRRRDATSLADAQASLVSPALSMPNNAISPSSPWSLDAA